MYNSFEPPFVSIILPIRNEGKYLSRCLTKVFSQNYPGERIEVIVVDGMSSDTTQEIICSFQQDHHNLKKIENEGKIVSKGMNAALGIAKGDIIIRVDGHCEISPEYVRNCVKHLLEDDVDGIGGSMNTIGETPLSDTIAIAMSSTFGVGGSAFRTLSGKTRLVDTVPFPAYTRQIIQKVGAYDEELIRNQDDEYNYRIRERGGKILMSADVLSQYYSRGSLSKLWKQYYQYGYWKVRVLQKHPLQMSLRQFAPPLFVFSLFVSLLLLFLFDWGWLLSVSIIGSYLIANFAAAILTASKKGWRHLYLLPVCYIILHISYGMGFLIGLVRFSHRWNDKKGFVPKLEPENAD